MLKNIHIDTGLFAFFAFTLIYPMDAIFYIGSFIMPSISVGFIGFALSIFFIPFFIFEKRPPKFYYMFSIYIVLAIVLGMLVVIGENFIDVDLWAYFRLFFISYIIGYFLSDFFSNSIQKYKSTINVFTIILLIGVSIFVIFHLFSAKIFIEANYLRFSESIALTGFVLLVLNDKLFHKVVIAVVIIVILFFAESRFSLFSFVLSSCFYFFLTSRKIFIYFLILFLAIISIVLIVDSEIITSSRYFRLIFHPSQDTSLNARKELLEKGLDVVSNKPYIGVFAYYREFCSGCYVHNVLSYWIEFGIAGIIFILTVVWVIIMGFFNSVKNILDKSTKQKYGYELFVLFSIYILIGVFFSKHWDYTSFFILIGAAFYMFKHRLLLKGKNKEFN
ncbi:MAG: hypothetical protein WEA99_11320 [Brumimicrobium sp.]